MPPPQASTTITAGYTPTALPLMLSADLVRHLGISKGVITFFKVSPILRMGNNKIQGVGFLCGSTMNGLKGGKINEGIINLAGIDIMQFIIIISFVIHVLSLKTGLISVPNMRNWWIRYDP